MGDREVKVSRARFPANLAEELPYLGGREITPTVFLKVVERKEIINLVVVTTPCRIGLYATPGAAGKLPFETGIVGAALGANLNCTAKRIQTEHRIRAGDECHCRDCILGYQVVVDDVTKWFVDAYTVLEYGKALRRTQQRGR